MNKKKSDTILPEIKEPVEDSISYVKVVLPIIIILILIGALAYNQFGTNSENKSSSSSNNSQNTAENEGGLLETVVTHPLQIAAMRKGEYPGSEVAIEQPLPAGSNYDRYIASYKSEGLKIYALLTVPQGEKPETGWPVVIFNHGYIPPAEYRTTERYIAYTDAFSRNGYIVFRSDYRGHGNSEGQASGGYGSTGYTVDVLNAVSSVKKLKDPVTGTGLIADSNRIGMWGHSMGGYVTLRSMVINKDIKAGVIWAGVVASYPDLINRWRRNTVTPAPTTSTSRGWRAGLVSQFGSPEENPEFWNSISANSYLADISGPIQLHHGTADHSVPVEFSENLDKQLNLAKKESELYVYEGDDHNIAANLDISLDRSVAFIDKYVKGIQAEQ